MLASMTTLFLLCGLPGTGKTTRARELAATHHAERLSPDEWMQPLFGASDPDGRRDVLEGRLIWTAAELLAVGTAVVLDFGFWGRDERAALHALARSRGAQAKTVYLSLDRETQLSRIEARWQEAPESTWPLASAALDEWRAMFEEPDARELAGEMAAHPSDGLTWPEWTAQRWPTSMEAS